MKYCYELDRGLRKWEVYGSGGGFYLEAIMVLKRYNFGELGRSCWEESFECANIDV